MCKFLVVCNRTTCTKIFMLVSIKLVSSLGFRMAFLVTKANSIFKKETGNDFSHIRWNAYMRMLLYIFNGSPTNTKALSVLSKFVPSVLQYGFLIIFWLRTQYLTIIHPQVWLYVGPLDLCGARHCPT